MALQKTERVQARIDPNAKKQLERAAAIKGVSVNAFVVTAAQEMAEKTIMNHGILSLGEQDSIKFAEHLIHPPTPNDALKRAAKRRKKNIQ